MRHKLTSFKELSAKRTRNNLCFEADVLNMALFGKTAKKWAAEKSRKEGNIRDYATIHQLVVLSNIESFNAELIRVGILQSKRLIELNQMAIRQLKALSSNTTIKIRRTLTTTAKGYKKTTIGIIPEIGK